jgi:hypothetical protein
VIQLVAAQLDRLYPSQVDSTPLDYGWRRQAGHSGHPAEDGEWACVGCYADGGNVGNPVFSIHPEDIDTLLARLEALEDAALDELTIATAEPFNGLRIRWHV